jgi:hypothetical protein
MTKHSVFSRKEGVLLGKALQQKGYILSLQDKAGVISFISFLVLLSSFIVYGFFPLISRGFCG